MNHMVIGYDDADRDDGREKEECPKCGGTGQKPDPWFLEMIPCKRCDGEGVI